MSLELSLCSVSLQRTAEHWRSGRNSSGDNKIAVRKKRRDPGLLEHLTTAGWSNCHEKATVTETDNYFKIAVCSDFSRSSVWSHSAVSRIQLVLLLSKVFNLKFLKRQRCKHSTIMKGSSEESIESTRPSNLQAFANISTLHGMSHIFAYGHMTFRRFLWTLSFLGSLGLLMLVCMDRVLYYLEYPHVTKLDEVAAANLTFPAVTFCNLNEFRFSKITRNDLYHVGELLALLNNNYQIANPHLADPEVLAALKDKANFQTFKPKLFNMTDFYNRTGHDINEMLLQCTFRGEDCYPVNFSTVSPMHVCCPISQESWPSGLLICLDTLYETTSHFCLRNVVPDILLSPVLQYSLI